MGRSRGVLAGLAVLLFAAFFMPSGQAAYTCFGQEATIVGTSRLDNLEGTEGPDVIVGLGGDDFLDGMGGDDRICGNGGNDLIDDDNGLGNDMISGGSGDDEIVGSSGGFEPRPDDDLMLGNGGSDSFSGLEGDDDIRGGAGNDGMSGDQGDDTLSGGSGDDVLDGMGLDPGTGETINDSDRLFGNVGADTLWTNDGDALDTLKGGPETDACVSDEGDTETSCETN
jgi:Ca2+-binding RTX toxin-like protein